MKYRGTELLLILGAFACIYIFWGATYLAVKIAIESIPPFLMAACRFFIAGSLLMGIAHLFWKPQLPTKTQLYNSAFAGILFLGIGTGGVAWALQYVDSGIAALIISAQPLLTMLLVWAMLKNAPVASSYLGIILGIGGMYLLVSQDHVLGQENSWLGILAIMSSMLAWGYSSVYIKKADMPKGQAQNAALQMLFGGLSLLIISLLTESYEGLSFSSISERSLLAFGFLVFFGSILAFSCFNFLLQRISPEKVSTSTYVNPIVAMFVGWWIGGELITNQSIMAALIMLIGVLFINIDLFALRRKRKLKTV